jgi:hypothetical protein
MMDWTFVCWCVLIALAAFGAGYGFVKNWQQTNRPEPPNPLPRLPRNERRSQQIPASETIRRVGPDQLIAGHLRAAASLAVTEHLAGRGDEDALHHLLAIAWAEEIRSCEEAARRTVQ